MTCTDLGRNEEKAASSVCAVIVSGIFCNKREGIVAEAIEQTQLNLAEICSAAKSASASLSTCMAHPGSNCTLRDLTSSKSF